MKYILLALLNLVYGILLFFTLSASTPGFLIVFIIAATLTLIGVFGIVLWLKKYADAKKGLQNDSAINSWLSMTRSFDIVLVIGLICRALILQPFIVEGSSMEPNFHDQEALLVDKITVKFNPIKRGETIIFRAPKNPQDDYIKRVIGLPGETIEINNGQVFIDNKHLTENYLNKNAITILSSGETLKQKLGANEYFVMGDNRNDSSDSRDWGTMPKINIVGRPWIIVYPLSNLGIVRNPLAI